MNATITAPAVLSDSTVEVPTPAEFAEPAKAGEAAAPTGAARPDDGHANAFSVASFVLGLVSIVAGWSFFAPITGLVLGIIALRRDTEQRTLALWGVWLNGILLAFTALAALVIAALVAVGIIALPVLAA